MIAQIATDSFHSCLFLRVEKAFFRQLSSLTVLDIRTARKYSAHTIHIRHNRAIKYHESFFQKAHRHSLTIKSNRKHREKLVYEHILMFVHVRYDFSYLVLVLSSSITIHYLQEVFAKPIWPQTMKPLTVSCSAVKAYWYRDALHCRSVTSIQYCGTNMPATPQMISCKCS